jgi:DNA-binding response OmpR family regulator
LAYLIQEAPRVVSATELVQEVQGYDVESWEASETVRQHIYRIRQKTKEMIGEDAVIDTVRGVGYTIYE